MSAAQRATRGQDKAGTDKRQASAAYAERSGDTQRISKLMLLIIAVILVLAAIGGAELYGIARSSISAGASFGTFMRNFDSAQRVSVYSIGNNSTQLGAAIGCSTAVVLQIERSPSTHRPASSIYYFSINSTACSYMPLGPNGTAISTTPSACLSMMSERPSIAIAYNNTNSTRISARLLRISGDSAYLARCGVASEIGG